MRAARRRGEPRRRAATGATGKRAARLAPILRNMAGGHGRPARLPATTDARDQEGRGHDDRRALEGRRAAGTCPAGGAGRYVGPPPRGASAAGLTTVLRERLRVSGGASRVT